ncbi:MAG: glycosyltransferase, partial [Planctomycetota bacterium]
MDSDCRATDNWMTEAIAKLIESDTDMLGGEVAFDISQNPSAAEYYDAIHNFQFEEKIKRG